MEFKFKKENSDREQRKKDCDKIKQQFNEINQFLTYINEIFHNIGNFISKNI